MHPSNKISKKEWNYGYSMKEAFYPLPYLEEINFGQKLVELMIYMVINYFIKRN